MKLFEMPLIEVVEFSVEDVITTSVGGNNCPNVTEDDEEF